MGISKKKMGGFLVTTLIFGSLIVTFMLILYKTHSNKNKYHSKVRLISHTDYTANFEFRIQKFYGYISKINKNGNLESFFNEEMTEKIVEEGFINYKVNSISKEIELIFEKNQYFNYNVIFEYNDENKVKLIIKNIQETRKNEN